ncbi:MAG: molybdate ABC transporter substrate-binding protein [Fibrobacteres bacterium]|nr:molybdate ABC transporter substrate-binding protein [Fibrobacterota bacterium]
MESIFSRVFISLTLIALTHQTFAQITVATAANMQFAMEEIASLYRKESKEEVKIVTGASGKLAAQIRSGAPFDVFVSADLTYPDTIVKYGLAAGKTEVYAYGVLVLWTIKPLDLMKGLALLSDPSIKKIAVGDLKLTVYGPAAQEAMQKALVYENVKTKLVFGDNIPQVAQYIITGSADIGFNAKSIVLSAPMAGKGRWVEVDRNLYKPIAQGAVILRHGKEHKSAAVEKFYAYLFGSSSRNVLTKYGYLLP